MSPLAATPTPRTAAGRIKRSAVQAIVGFIPAVVVLLNENHLNATHAVKYGGTSAGAVLVISILQNVAEARGWLKPNG